jgi:hypothetical protein
MLPLPSPRHGSKYEACCHFQAMVRFRPSGTVLSLPYWTLSFRNVTNASPLFHGMKQFTPLSEWSAPPVKPATIPA